jgi:hypothetical protein
MFQRDAEIMNIVLAGATARERRVRFVETRPAHGECGGYMVLGQDLTDATGHAHPMAGLLGASFSFANRKLHLGYRQARLVESHPLGAKGSPRGLNHTDHGLPAGVDVNVFHRDLLLALAAMAIERVEQHGKGAGKLAGLL